MNPYASATAAKYKSLEVNSSNRLKVVVMIYDAAIASLKHALLCHTKNDLIKRNQFISRTQFIVQELNNALDMKNGKEIAASLRKIYFFINRHLNEVMTDNNAKKIEQVISILSRLREAWQEISQKAAHDNAVEPDIDRFHRSNVTSMDRSA
ncbi:MAG: flagellar export chaperone FliS [Desulfobacterota bacterium]|nr:flagellar export chaperone FliS [Thermodesulfobacteriota bacterium]